MHVRKNLLLTLLAPHLQRAWMPACDVGDHCSGLCATGQTERCLLVFPGLSFLLLLLLLQPLRVALRLGSAQECASSLVWVIDYLTKKGGRSTADALAFNHSTSPSMYMALPWAPRAASSSSHLCLSVRDDELWQALARVINHIDDAVVSARPRLQGPVRASLHTVIVLAELPAPVAEFLAFPDLFGLERVAAQHLDQEQVVVRAILVRL